MNYLLGIDIGTSACKVILVDKNGKILSQKSEAHDVIYPQKGWAEQNPDDWWNSVCCAVKNVISQAKINPKDICCIGADGQSWSAIAVDKSGNVLCNTPIWMDTRADDICNEWNKRIGEDKIFEISGNPLKPAYTTPKVGWYKKYKPNVYENTYKILQSNGFINLRLTGKFTQDKSQGYGWHCFDIKHCDWNFSLCEEFGIKPSLLPDIFDCTDIIGAVTQEAAAQTGLAPGTPVVAGGLDAACGALGVGVIRAGETQEQGGQAGGMSICCDTAITEKTLICGCHVIPGKWLLQGGTVGGGGVMKWLEKEFGDYERSIASKTAVSSFKLLDGLAENIPPGSDGLVFLPYMAGERSPIWDKQAKGIYYGIDFSKTKGHFIRAALEGVAFSLKHNLDVADASGAVSQELLSMGGAANSCLWTQIKADITGRIIKVPASDTATTMGAVILAGVGIGLFKNFQEAVEKLIDIKQIYYPNPDNKSVYEKNYTMYLNLYPALKEISEKGDC